MQGNKMRINSEKLKVILPLLVLFIYGLIAYGSIKFFGGFATLLIMLIMTAFPIAFIEFKKNEKNKG